MNFKSLFKAALVAVTILYAFGASAQNAVFPAAQMDPSGNVLLPGGPTLGVYSHGVFTPSIPAGTVLVKSGAAPAHEYVSGVDSSGNLTFGYVNFSDVVGTASAAQGGSGLASPAAHSLMIAEGASAYNLLAAGTAGRIPIDQGAGVDPAYEVMSGDAAIAANGAVTLAASGVTAGTYGDATHVAQVAVDAKGRTTSAGSVAITHASLDLAIANNLSDLQSATAARANLGLTPGTGLAISGSSLNLQPASASTIGGVESYAQIAHQWIYGITTAGVPQSSQPACGDLSNSGTNCQTSAGTGLAISGSALNLQPAASATIGGVESIASLSHNWVAYIDTSGIPHQSQPAFSDISGSVSLSTQATGTLQAAQEPAHTGDVTNTAGSLALTLVTVNSSPGPVCSTSAIPVMTTNAKGLVTSQTTASIAAPLSGITGLGSNISTSLANAVATTSQIWSGTTNYLLDSGQVFNAAGALQALSGTTSVTPDFSTGFNFNFTATSANNYTLQNPSNMKVGQSGCIDLYQPASGTVVTIAFGADWYFSGGTAPTLTATLGAEDLFCYWVRSSSVVVGTMISNVRS